MYYRAFKQIKKTLGQIDNWLDQATKFAKEKSMEPNLFVTFRLAPDQLAFARQIQIACDTAKLCAARITGKEFPAQEDKEVTLEELRARVHSVIKMLDSLTEKDFEGAGARSITQPRWEGKTMTGEDYFFEHALPNFYFHTTTAYAILRHNGVPVGKKDFLGPLTQHAPK